MRNGYISLTNLVLEQADTEYTVRVLLSDSHNTMVFQHLSYSYLEMNKGELDFKVLTCTIDSTLKVVGLWSDSFSKI